MSALGRFRGVAPMAMSFAPPHTGPVNRWIILGPGIEI
jgi:hypothetical protein